MLKSTVGVPIFVSRILRLTGKLTSESVRVDTSKESQRIAKNPHKKEEEEEGFNQNEEWSMNKLK